MVARGRRQYTTEYREEAVQLVLASGRSIAAVARELGVKRGHAGKLGYPVSARACWRRTPAGDQRTGPAA